jgi:hypothetical protein
MSDFSFLASSIQRLEKELGSEREERKALQAKVDELDQTIREQGHAIRNTTTILNRLVDILDPKNAKPVEPVEE